MEADLPHQNVKQAETRSKRVETFQIAVAPSKTGFSVRGLPPVQQAPCSLPVAEGLLRLF